MLKSQKYYTLDCSSFKVQGNMHSYYGKSCRFLSIAIEIWGHYSVQKQGQNRLDTLTPLPKAIEPIESQKDVRPFPEPLLGLRDFVFRAQLLNI